MNLRRTSIRNFTLVLPLFVILFAQAIIHAQAPPNSTFCANDTQVCAFDGEREVIYGANGTFIRKVIKGGSVCLPETFGIADPLLNVLKSCYIVNSAPVKVVRDTGNVTTTPVDPGKITRTITLKNNVGVEAIYGLFTSVSGYNEGDSFETRQVVAQIQDLGYGQSASASYTSPLNENVQFNVQYEGATVFKAELPKNKDIAELCYEVSGTYFNLIVKACGGGATYESKYILFKNEAGYNASMSLTYYSLRKSGAATDSTVTTTPGYQRKIYLPFSTDFAKPVTLKVESGGNLLTKDVGLGAFDSSGTSCYKVWGSIFSKKVSPCSANTSARTIKLKNNGAYQAKIQVIYDDGGTSKSVTSNPLEVLESDTVEVPTTTSKTPIKIRFLAYNKEFNQTTVSADFTGELCYKLEGTAFAPTSATCDDTVGDTSGDTRQIRFQNDAGYDAQMIVIYFVDEVIGGTKVTMPKSLTTGMINGLGGKFRLVTIPKNTSKGMAITISIQGSTTVKNDIFSTTLPADFAASPQPCFKVTGTTFNPEGGKCNQ